MVKSYYEHEVEEGHKGVCQKFAERGYGVINDGSVHLVAYLVSFIILIWWVKGHYAGISSGFYTSNDQIIFPIHLKVLGLLTISMFLEAIFSMIYDFLPSGRHSVVLSTLSIICLGLSSALLGGITMLLISAAIGRRAMKRAVKVGALCGVITITCNLMIVGYEDSIIVELLVALWEFVILIVLCCIWMAPKFGVLSFRPAAIFWSRFWAFFRILLIISFFLIEFQVDVGTCLYHFSNYLFYSILNAWVVYHAFVLEAQWWHGMYVHPGSNQSKGSNSYQTKVVNFLNKLCCFSKDDNIMHTIDAGALNFKEEEGEDAESDINFAFTGIELSGASAQAMSEVFDTYRKTKATLTSVDNTLDISAHNSMHGRRAQSRGSNNSTTATGGYHDIKEGNIQQHTPPSFRSRALSSITPSSFVQKNSTLGKEVSLQKLVVPMIDFTKLKMLSNRMLGTGSSARVYEGRWHEKVCAVKVLFTVEITPDEIKRTCYEASLLHHLCKHSQHVVRLFGVAVLPPSLCVVLEYCNGGSLFDILYQENDVPQNSSIRSLTSSSSSFSFTRNKKSNTSNKEEGGVIHQPNDPNRLSFVNRLSFSLDALRFSDSNSSNMSATAAAAGGEDVVSRLGEMSMPDMFKHQLTWLHKLDLAYGASLGIEAVATHLPGYSHNDIKSANFLVSINDTATGGGGSRATSSASSTLFHHHARKSIESMNKNNIASKQPKHQNDHPQEFFYCVKIADMEFASKNVTPQHMKTGATNNWVAPEVLNGENVSTASDMYALANVFYEIETRKIPFHDLRQQQDIKMNIKAGKRPKFTPLLNTTKNKRIERGKMDGRDENNEHTEVASSEKELSAEMRSLIQIEEDSRQEFRYIIESCWAQSPLERSDIHSVSSALFDLRHEFIQDVKKYEHTKKQLLKEGNSIYYADESKKRMASFSSVGNDVESHLDNSRASSPFNEIEKESNSLPGVVI